LASRSRSFAAARVTIGFVLTSSSPSVVGFKCFRVPQSSAASCKLQQKMSVLGPLSFYYAVALSLSFQIKNALYPFHSYFPMAHRKKLVHYPLDLYFIKRGMHFICFTQKEIWMIYISLYAALSNILSNNIIYKKDFFIIYQENYNFYISV